MKLTALAALLFIACAVGYLAYSDYQARRVAADVADRLSDPDGYIARTWADNANLDCDVITDVESRDTVSGIRRPMRFTCYASTGTWVIEDRDCPQKEVRSTGPPTKEGEMYKPLAALCWFVTQKP